MWTNDEDESVQAELDRLYTLACWLDDLGGIVIPNTQRETVAAGCLDQALEHQKAILLLTRGGLHGSAHALVRSIFESFVRGMWLYRCASDDEVAAFVNEDSKGLPHLRDSSRFVSDIEDALGHISGVLGDFREQYWKVLCGFAHTGVVQAHRRFGDDESRGYQAREVIFVLRAAGFIGLFALLETAWIGRQPDVAESIVTGASWYLKAHPGSPINNYELDSSAQLPSQES